MTKAELVEQVAEAVGPGVTKRDCALVVDGFLGAMRQAIARGDHIEIRGFGTFKVRRRKPRLARNPRTGERVAVPARMVPIFKPSKLMRADVERLGEEQAEGAVRGGAPGAGAARGEERAREAYPWLQVGR